MIKILLSWWCSLLSAVFRTVDDFFFLKQLKVTRPDSSPATGAKIRVTIARGWYSEDKFYNKTFVVTNGLITDSINDATYNAKSLVFKVGTNLILSFERTFFRAKLQWIWSIKDDRKGDIFINSQPATYKWSVVHVFLGRTSRQKSLSSES